MGASYHIAYVPHCRSHSGSGSSVQGKNGPGSGALQAACYVHMHNVGRHGCAIGREKSRHVNCRGKTWPSNQETDKSVDVLLSQLPLFPSLFDSVRSLTRAIASLCTNPVRRASFFAGRITAARIVLPCESAALFFLADFLACPALSPLSDMVNATASSFQPNGVPSVNGDVRSRKRIQEYPKFWNMVAVLSVRLEL
jgi:hypothetical protein